jgi:hypothetical protein
MISNYQANRILDRSFGNVTFTVPTTMYLGLSTTTINADGTGITEPSAVNGYARVSITNDKTQWGNASTGTLANIAAFTFPQSSSSWGTITYVFLSDSVTIGAGNLLFYDTLSPSRTVASLTTVLFAITAFQVLMNNT